MMSLMQMCTAHFLAKDVLGDAENNVPWAPIINTGSTVTDKKNRSTSSTPFTSLSNLFTEEVEKEDLVWIYRRSTAQEIWLRCVAFMLTLGQNGRPVSIIRRSGGPYLLTGRDCKPEVAHKDIGKREGCSTGFFFISNGPQEGKFYLCKGTDHFVFYSMKKKRKLAETVKLGAVVLPPYSIFIGRGYLQHAVAEYHGAHSTRYHLYLMPSGNATLGSICFDDERALQLSSKAEHISSMEEKEEIVGGAVEELK